MQDIFSSQILDKQKNDELNADKVVKSNYVLERNVEWAHLGICYSIIQPFGRFSSVCRPGLQQITILQPRIHFVESKKVSSAKTPEMLTFSPQQRSSHP